MKQSLISFIYLAATINVTQAEDMRGNMNNNIAKESFGYEFSDYSNYKDSKKPRTFYIIPKDNSKMQIRDIVIDFAERHAFMISADCAKVCKIHVINNKDEIIISYGAFMKGNYSSNFFKIDGKTNLDIIDKYQIDALIYLHNLAVNDLESITMTHLYQPSIARLYYWFSIEYGFYCTISEANKTRLQITATETTTYPYSSPIVTNREYTYYTVEKKFVDRAAQYGNWYVTGLIEQTVRKGVRHFIEKYSCKSKEVKNVRKNLYKFGTFHDEMWGEQGF